MINEPVATDRWTEISALLDQAFFPSTFESTLVAGLRKSGRELMEWVICRDGQVAAHVAFTKAYRGTSAVGYHMAPLAVHPHFQRRGFGTALVSQVLRDSRLAAAPIFVLGHPSFYARFGFRRIASPICPFEPSNEHFHALRWVSNDKFTIGYEPEFHATLPSK